MLDDWIGRKVVVDLRSPYVCLGTLERLDDHWLELRHADLHDFRDSETTARSMSPIVGPRGSNAIVVVFCWPVPRWWP